MFEFSNYRERNGCLSRRKFTVTIQDFVVCVCFYCISRLSRLFIHEQISEIQSDLNDAFDLQMKIIEPMQNSNLLLESRVKELNTALKGGSNLRNPLFSPISGQKHPIDPYR